MKANLYEVSDRIAMLRHELAEGETHGMHFDADQVSQLRRELKDIAALSLANEHQISRHRWNALARLEREEEAIVAEATRPGSNVILLSRTALPFSDGGFAA